ncbi:MAG: hypothetical protein ACRC5V_02145 [Aeromonas sp.]
MQIHYIDAENVGMSFLDELSISMLDRVFIFTHTAKKNNEHSNPAITYVSTTQSVTIKPIFILLVI